MFAAVSGRSHAPARRGQHLLVERHQPLLDGPVELFDLQRLGERVGLVLRPDRDLQDNEGVVLQVGEDRVARPPG